MSNRIMYVKYVYSNYVYSNSVRVSVHINLLLRILSVRVSAWINYTLLSMLTSIKAFVYTLPLLSISVLYSSL